jgi:RNA polymerase sigma-70 factor, ECF subfamily
MKTDADLLTRTIAGDSDAFSEIYNRYKSDLFCYACAIVRDRTLAEDVIHDTFMQLFKAGHTIRSPGALRQWLYVVVRRFSFNALRWNQRSEPLDENTLGEEPSPVDIVERNATDELVRQAIGRLSPGFREVIFLREYLQLSYEEICDLTGTTLPAVKSKLFKARKALTAALAPDFE